MSVVVLLDKVGGIFEVSFGFPGVVVGSIAFPADEILQFPIAGHSFPTAVQDLVHFILKVIFKFDGFRGRREDSIDIIALPRAQFVDMEDGM